MTETADRFSWCYHAVLGAAVEVGYHKHHELRTCRPELFEQHGLPHPPGSGWARVFDGRRLQITITWRSPELDLEAVACAICARAFLNRADVAIEWRMIDASTAALGWRRE